MRHYETIEDWLDKNVPKSAAFNERLSQFIKSYVISYKDDKTYNGRGPQKESKGYEGEKIQARFKGDWKGPWIWNEGGDENSRAPGAGI